MSSIGAWDAELDDLTPASSAVLEALERVVPCTAELISAADERSVPGLDWRAIEVGTHLAAMAAQYRGLAEGGAPFHSEIEDRAVVIREGMQERAGRTATELGDAFASDVAGIVDALRDRGSTDLVSWYGEHRLTAGLLACTVLGELAVHGCDLARASGGSTHIDDDVALLAMHAVAAETPLFLSARGRTRAATMHYRIRGDDGYTVELAPDAPSVLRGLHGRADIRFTADPVPFLLWSYGRLGALRPFLGGGVRVGGRRPWLIVPMAGWFETA